jgi:hypothetical protein
MAKDLIRTRHQITKFYQLKSQLQGVSLRVQVAMCLLLSSLYLGTLHSLCQISLSCYIKLP